MKSNKIEIIGGFIIVCCLIFMMLYTGISLVLKYYDKKVNSESLSSVKFKELYPNEDGIIS
ncbi:MAG: hypothetical protein IKD76_01590 [Clostridia bacterium]|nr:hypothetical protein [Clostridia bacterium]